MESTLSHSRLQICHHNCKRIQASSDDLGVASASHCVPSLCISARFGVS